MCLGRLVYRGGKVRGWSVWPTGPNGMVFFDRSCVISQVSVGKVCKVKSVRACSQYLSWMRRTEGQGVIQ